MIDAIHENLFQDVAFQTEPNFNLSIPTTCTNVPSTILNPIDAWSDKAAYEQQAGKLKTLFDNNIVKFQ
jgi:phosphoenolpyruvate carboxykinase (ATP)